MGIKAESVSLEKTGPTLSLKIDAGRTVAIFGPANSGQGQLIRILMGQEKPAKGKVSVSEPSVPPMPTALGKKLTPLDLAKQFAGAKGEGRAAEALSATHLWEVRKQPLAKLSENQFLCCQLLGVLSSPSRILGFECGLDSLDLWQQSSILGLLSKRLREGASLVFSTHSPSLAERADQLVVLNAGRILFVGTQNELASRTDSTEVTVETNNHQGIRALVEPLKIKVEEVPGGVRFRAPEGQELAAKLLAQGYGDVRCVIVKNKSFEELIRSLIP